MWNWTTWFSYQSEVKMARKKSIDAYKVEIKKQLKEKKLIIGTDSVIKSAKTDKLKRVYFSRNTPENVKKDITYYSKLGKIEVIALNLANDELGELCNKPFSISVLGVKA